MHADDTTESRLYQPMASFQNIFDDPRFEKRSIAIVDNDTEKDQPLYLPGRTKMQKNDHAPAYIPDKERFSIQSILALGQSNTESSLVVDVQNPCEITDPQLDSKQLQRNRSLAGNELDFSGSASGPSDALQHKY
ncbi:MULTISPECIES: hypothetical protein [unclassified Endozoicomonas]|uniref:hypothetical protein n=1 Tax=unclassified Endozoicomonas TaxID=2644528 RepID=UPI003BB4E4F8